MSATRTVRDWRIYQDPQAPEATLALRLPDGTQLCVACGCPAEDGHNPYGQRECKDPECPCARLVLDLPQCPECGQLFQERWRCQNHMLPTPSCRRAAFGAGGKYASLPKFVPPLLKKGSR